MAQKKACFQDLFSGKECDERLGWFKPGADDKVRTLLTSRITKALTANLVKKAEDKEDGTAMMDEDMDMLEEDEEDPGGGAGGGDDDDDDMGEIVDEIIEEMGEDPEEPDDL